jgi:hypothetical protein
MSQSRWARLAQCEAQLGGHGELVTITCHACQSQAAVEDMASRQLKRGWRKGDMLIILEQTDSCAPGPHTHHKQQITVSPRKD